MPSRPSTRSPRSEIRRGGGSVAATSIVPGTSLAPQSSIMSFEATRCARIASSGWSCFSKRFEASERRPSLREVRRMLTPFQVAISSRTEVVVSDTSEASPPMIPATPEGPLRSQTSTASVSKRRSTPSSVRIVSPSLAVRTWSSPPGTMSRSNACSGCAVISITKLVMSTTLLIGRWPAALSQALSQSGEGPIVTSVKTRAVNRGQSSGTSTVTEAWSATEPSPFGWASSAQGGVVSSAPVIARTSRATP
jgi:hypothetical protein